MKTKDFSTSFSVDQTPEQVFAAILNPRAWWSEEIEGDTTQLNSLFKYRYQDIHRSELKVIELIQNKKVVWLVTKNHFAFTADKTEWTNTKLSFEITAAQKMTTVLFTHNGLVPDYECFEICTDAWTNYIQNSLRNLITKGKGEPNPKEGGFNESLIEKHQIKTKK